MHSLVWPQCESLKVWETMEKFGSPHLLMLWFRREKKCQIWCEKPTIWQRKSRISPVPLNSLPSAIFNIKVKGTLWEKHSLLHQNNTVNKCVTPIPPTTTSVTIGSSSAGIFSASVIHNTAPSIINTNEFLTITAPDTSLASSPFKHLWTSPSLSLTLKHFTWQFIF